MLASAIDRRTRPFPDGPQVKRIFLTLATISNLALATAFGLGWVIGDPGAPDRAVRQAVSLHLLVALGAALLCLLVHAIALTYFMGTGRWIEETCEAYRLGEAARQQNIRLKYRVIPGMVFCILLLIATGALGAMSDPGASRGKALPSVIHFTAACLTLGANLFVSFLQLSTISRNGTLVDAIVTEVREIRRSRGLDS